MDPVKSNDQRPSRRRVRWIGLPESLRDVMLARMLARSRDDERSGRARLSDVGERRALREARAQALSTEPEGRAS